MKYTSQKNQLSLDLFRSSFNDLPKTNRWVMLAGLLPWDKLEKEYNSRLNNEARGAGNKPARMVLGACVIKHKLNLSDKETILMIPENPYMQPGFMPLTSLISEVQEPSKKYPVITRCPPLATLFAPTH